MVYAKIRSKTNSIFKTGIFNNKYLVYAVLCSFVLMLAVLFVPFLQDIFNVVTLSGRDTLIVVVLSFMPVVIVELLKLFRLNSFKDEN